LPRATIADLQGGDAADNAAALLRLLDGAGQGAEDEAYRNIVLLNAAAAAVVADRVDDLRAGVALATTALKNGAAKNALAQLREATAHWRE
jgi:anthranilate phosphoribosyltransferase